MGRPRVRTDLPRLPDPPAGAPVERWLDDHRPDLGNRYRAELPGARAAVLARLWGALLREPIAGLTPQGDGVIGLADGRRLRGDAALAEPFAVAPAGFTLWLDGAGVTDPGRLVGALPLTGAGARERLATELYDSVAGLALARAAQPVPHGGDAVLATLAMPADARDGAGRDRVADAEQLVVDGHPLHPCCRTRTGLSPAELLAYAPEHGRVVDLAIVEVPADRWLTTSLAPGAGLAPRLPVHPWQRDHVLDRYPGLRLTGGRIPARPLMSLRTLAPVAAPDRHLKTAVDVQMTSAVRTVSAAAVHNGPALSALLATLARHTPRLTVLREVAAGAVLVDGEACRSLAVVHRQAPRPGPDEAVLPLAALAARSPADGRPVAVEAVRLAYPAGETGARAFFTDLVRLLVPPLLTLLQLGVALEAHGQNTLVVLRRGRPVRLLYRDVGGVRVSPRRLARHGIQAPPLHGDVASDDPVVLRTKLAAALFSTVIGELVSVLTREYDVGAQALWDEVARIVRATRAGLASDAASDAGALFDPTLPVKAMTAMRLSDSPVDDLWAALPNPMAGLA